MLELNSHKYAIKNNSLSNKHANKVFMYKYCKNQVFYQCKMNVIVVESVR